MHPDQASIKAGELALKRRAVPAYVKADLFHLGSTSFRQPPLSGFCRRLYKEAP